MIGIVGNDVKVVTKEYTRLILSGAGEMETTMFFSVDQNLSWTLNIADSIISSFPHLPVTVNIFFVSLDFLLPFDVTAVCFSIHSVWLWAQSDVPFMWLCPRSAK